MKTADELLTEAEQEKELYKEPLIPNTTFSDDISHLDISKIPQIDAYALAVVNERGQIVKTLNNDDLKVKASELLEFMFMDIKANKRFYNAHNLLKDIVEVKKAFMPEMAKQMNIDATSAFDEYINKWKEERLKLKPITEVEAEIKEVEDEVEKVEVVTI